MIVVVAGPTASGKSALAIEIAARVRGEIVCADSRQIYAGIPIASAGPTPDDEARAPHHGYGAIDPRDAHMSAGKFVAFADAWIDQIRARGRTPILVGGTGLYLRAWRLGLDDPSDPAAAERDMDAMIKRAPRAQTAGARWLHVDATLEFLEPRIRARARQMFAPEARRGGGPSIAALDEAHRGGGPDLAALDDARRGGGPYMGGVVDEAVALAAALPAGHKLLETLGTAEALAVHAGTIDVDEAVRLTTLRTRQYARRQRTWFKKEPWWTRLDATLPRDVLVDNALGALGSID